MSERRSPATGTWKHLCPGVEAFIYVHLRTAFFLVTVTDYPRLPPSIMQFGTWSLANRMAARLLFLSTPRPHTLLWVS